jgi:hypothetical protein
MPSADALDIMLRSFAANLHVALPGIVRSYDAETQTCEVQPACRAAIPSATDDEDGDDTIESLPILTSVPVCWPRGGGFFMHAPLAEGDAVLLVFCESDINAWRQTANESDPGMDLRHGLSGAVAIPGLFPRNAPLTRPGQFPNDLTIGDDDGAFVRVLAGGTVEIGGANALALHANLNQHLSAIAASLTVLATATGATVTYGTPDKATYDTGFPFDTDVIKGA